MAHSIKIPSKGIAQGAWTASLSVFIALLPKCGFCLAAYLNLFSVLGISVVKYYRWILPVLTVLLCGSLLFSYAKAKKSHDYRPFLVSCTGVVLLLLGKVFLKSDLLNWAGIFLLMTASVFQWIQTRKSCSGGFFPLCPE